MAKSRQICEYDALQEKYCKKIIEIYIKLNLNRCPRAFVRTYGCQQNVSDSEKYSGMLLSMGFELTDIQNEADVILFNTCAIRENAENKVLGHLGRLKNLKKENPNLFVVLCGCMMEQKEIVEKIKKVYPFVDLIFGTNEIYRFPEIFYNALMKNKTTVSEKNEVICENIPIKRDNNLKAFVPIIQGCNNYCSYCIVPYVRGNERSRDPGKIAEEFKNLIDAGYKDITLLGQNVNSYGKNLSKNIDFPDLLKNLDSLDGEYRIRFMTSHPKDASHKLIDIISKNQHISKHLHLPVQSGSNKILKFMNRKYTRESYLEIINYAKEKMPGLMFTSDIIVGFPGETYEDFKETLSLIKEVKFTSLFTFIYSSRPGTPAANLPDPIPHEEKMKWFTELLEIQEDVSLNLRKNMIGSELEILVESKGSNDVLLGRTDGNLMVEINDTDANILGTFQKIKITGVKRESLKG